MEGICIACGGALLEGSVRHGATQLFPVTCRNITQVLLVHKIRQLIIFLPRVRPFLWSNNFSQLGKLGSCNFRCCECLLQLLGDRLSLPREVVTVGSQSISGMGNFDLGMANVFDFVRLLRFLQHLTSTYFGVLHQRRGLRVAYIAKVFLVCLGFELHRIAEGVNDHTGARQVMALLLSLAQGCPQVFLCVRAFVHLINILFHHAPTRS